MYSWFFQTLCDQQHLNALHMSGHQFIPFYPTYSCHCEWCMAFASELLRLAAEGTSNSSLSMTADPEINLTDAPPNDTLNGAPLAFATPAHMPHQWMHGTGPRSFTQQDLCLNGDDWVVADNAFESVKGSLPFYPSETTLQECQRVSSSLL
ncbi:hypothetical protein CGMCC3_g17966 [Colletotrichum fructicola]|uniref:Uncharacterized protein n=1 Tax=Colletotrichum fructicola (strain Nara gc5) TaxID=1213859 RepID=A0A7J6IGK7_COLFN|nr:uncharacterized protein CGMCC3_g17966 [Colletotrichum fructicola]KAE9565856.1 hypothetical protein CGMCC3_g17966 [Colletotrichum fructicola]KAF4432887.1 hypothetical protein CFRS1_v007749 [Colletotrichum fructicola]KAF4474820.1 hypothetical protein CGGC5_v015950 [Colletotrichum fructicola Nara gc5]KAF4474937.1 hypothetical protein CGGC5_v016081 [Colletotrichum fructicola Nara gc5]